MKTEALEGGLLDPDFAEGLPKELKALRLMERHYQGNFCSTHVWNRGNYLELEVGRRQILRVVEIDWTCREDYPSELVWLAPKDAWDDPEHYYWHPMPEFIHFINTRMTHFIRVPVEERTRWKTKRHPNFKREWYVIWKKHVDFWPLTGRRTDRKRVQFREPLVSEFNPEKQKPKQKKPIEKKT